MATQDESETPEQIKGRRLMGCQRAFSDAEPLLTFAGAYDRVVTAADVSAGKTVGELVSDLLNAKYDEIAAGDAD
jgi:hypothetical protein